MDCDLAADPAKIGAAWSELARQSLAPSGYNSPELLIPAIGILSGGRLATVSNSTGLRLAMPLVPRHLPMPYLENWCTQVNFFSLPHLDRDLAVPALTALLRKAGQPVLLHSVPVFGPLWDALALASGHMETIDSWERAVLRPKTSYDQWFEGSFERKRRKEYRRLKARLSEQGQFEVHSLQPGDDAATWVDEFLEIEAGGWKGMRGTAIKADAMAVSVLHKACRGLAESGKLRFWKLALDGKAIATLFAIVDGSEAWLGKIAHDERLARYSPGALLILHATEMIFAEGLTQADSCAIPDHPMINHMWKDRLAVADVMVAPATVGILKFNATVKAECLRRNLRARVRNVLYKFTGRHRS